MEFLILSAVLGTGYVLNKNKKDDAHPDDINVDSPLYNDVDNMLEPNRKLIRNDYSDKKLPLEFKDRYGNQIGDNRLISENKGPNEMLNEVTRNAQRESVSSIYGYSLTGEKIDPKKFVHNNMVPFFGGSVKQNVDEYATNTILDTYTGNDITYQKKKEIPSMFDPQANVGNPYGTSNLSGYQQERYIPSNKRANDTPIERTYVGPGLNNGYTAKPDGGFQQMAKRDYIMPKSVDELRVKTNPKMVYQGRINPGKKISRTGKIGQVKKRTPEGFFVNTPDRLFTAVGQQTAPKLRPAHIMKITNREKNGPDNHYGPAVSTQTKASQRAKVAKSRRIALPSSGMRHLDGGGRWSINSKSKSKRELHDYGKSGYRLKPNSRQRTQKCSQPINLKGDRYQGRAPNDPKLKLTKNVGHEMNEKWTSNVQMTNRGIMVVNPDMKAKTTTRETTLYSSETAGIAKGNIAPRVYNPDMKAKTTTRETTLYSSETTGIAKGNIAPRVYNPDDYAKTTIRQTTLSDYTGNADGPKQQRSRESAMNATVRTLREDISRGRAPTKVGPKLITGKGHIKMTTRKSNKLNKIIAQRSHIKSSRAQIPNIENNKINFTKQRKDIKSQNIANRLDTYMVDAFKQNPYTQSLNSFC